MQNEEVAMFTSIFSRRTVLWVVILFFAATAFGVDGDTRLVGTWQGAYVRNNAVQLTTVTFSLDHGTLAAVQDVPELLVFHEAVQIGRAAEGGFSLDMKYGEFKMLLTPDGDEMTGVNDKWGPPVMLHLKRSVMIRGDLHRDEVFFRARHADLRGLVERIPDGKRRPAIVILPGSGVQGIDTGYYKFWADYFATLGFVAMVYDKRGVGRSPGNVATLSIAQLSDDPVSAYRFLLRRKDVLHGSIGFMGISQGGWVAPLAAERDGVKAAFVILLAGPAVSVFEQELERVKYSMLAEERPQQEVTEALSYTRTLLDVAAAGGRGETLRVATARAASQPWAAYVESTPTQETLAGWKALQYDPKDTLSKLRVPVLALFGERDVLVPPAENAPAMKAYFAAATNQDATIETVAGAQHNMELFGRLVGGKWDWPRGYWRWAKRSPELYRDIEDWLHAHSLQLESGAYPETKVPAAVSP